MRTKLIARLCVASALVGAVVAQPVTRKAKKETVGVLGRGASKYVETRDKVVAKAQATGKPGKAAVGAARIATQGAGAVAGKWRELVKKAERERDLAPKQKALDTVVEPVDPAQVDIEKLMASRN